MVSALEERILQIKSSGAVLPAVVVGFLILATCTTLLKASEAGPGSMHAPIIMSSDRRTCIRSICTEIKNVLCRKYPRYDPDEKL